MCLTVRGRKRKGGKRDPNSNSYLGFCRQGHGVRIGGSLIYCRKGGGTDKGGLICILKNPKGGETCTGVWEGGKRVVQLQKEGEKRIKVHLKVYTEVQKKRNCGNRPRQKNAYSR